jgi:hypothetical protein
MSHQERGSVNGATEGAVTGVGGIAALTEVTTPRWLSMASRGARSRPVGRHAPIDSCAGGVRREAPGNPAHA